MRGSLVLFGWILIVLVSSKNIEGNKVKHELKFFKKERRLERMRHIKAYMQKALVSGVGVTLSALAVMFANAPCKGYLYETEIPKKLRKK